MKTLLEQEILKIINEVTESEYIGKLEVDVDDDWYTLKLYLNMHLSPMVFAFQGTEEQFKNYIKEEMKARKLEKIFRYQVLREILLPFEEECDEDED